MSQKSHALQTAGRPLKIALDLDRSVRFDCEIALGVIAYARANTTWQLTSSGSSADATISANRAPVPSATAAVKTKDRPMVASVSCDVDALARVAVDHLADNGFRRFAGAYLGETLGPAVEEAIRVAMPAGATYLQLTAEHDVVRPGDLLKLEFPCALICRDDATAAAALDAALRAGIDVPHRLAILGIGDDPLACELTEVPLSSIDPNAQLIGFRLAGQLDKTIRTRRPPRPTVVRPIGVTARASTDVLAIEDEDLAAAVRLLRSNAHRPVAIGDMLRDMLRAVPLHRRSLERRFRSVLGRSPLEELRHARVGIAEKLLARTDLPLGDIAVRAGFSAAQHLTTAFKLTTGITPSAYRQQFQRR